MTKDEMLKLAQTYAETLKTPPLRDDSAWPKPPAAHIDKCGVLPYRVVNGRIEYYLFEPKGTKPELGPAGFQIAKGTRESHDGEQESLIVTALREGIEEIGLPLDSIDKAGNWGEVEFTSASKGTKKSMWLYPLKMDEAVEFNEPDAIHAATVAREWFDIQNREESRKIRPDHLQVIRQIDRVLRKEQAQNKGLEK